MARIRGVIFDADGVVFDTQALICAGHAMVLRQHGIPFDRQLLDYGMHFRGWRDRFLGILEKLQSQGTDISPEAAASILEGEEYARWRVDQTESMTKCYPGIKGLLRQLKQDHLPVGLVTARCDDSIYRALMTTGLTRAFSVTVSADDVRKTKPHPVSLRRALRFLGLKPTEVLYVGDDFVDLEMGFRAEVPTAFAGWGFWGWRGEDGERVQQWEAVVKGILDRLAGEVTNVRQPVFQREYFRLGHPSQVLTLLGYPPKVVSRVYEGEQLGLPFEDS